MLGTWFQELVVGVPISYRTTNHLGTEDRKTRLESSVMSRSWEQDSVFALFPEVVAVIIGFLLSQGLSVWESIT